VAADCGLSLDTEFDGLHHSNCCASIFATCTYCMSMTVFINFILGSNFEPLHDIVIVNTRMQYSYFYMTHNVRIIMQAVP
jgi:hypothetical protein